MIKVIIILALLCSPCYAEHLYPLGKNTTGHTKYVQSDDTVAVTSIWHAYGGFQDQSETIDLAAGVWEKITNAGNNLWGGVEADGLTLANDTMTIVNAGDYVGTLSITLSGLANKDFLVRCHNNTQAAVTYHVGITTTSATNYANVCVPLYLECDAGDELEMAVYSDDGSDPTFKDAIFYLAYIHD